ncbi:7400_t:CDS:2 [Gigaspora margarita]|uniref:7400_t:CDS:1 n=1 Tax=Gigaspora margarita TaxID=4874 RepID=A0ABM8W4P1_GIGMA|nr:7400_t:CDS:2 [Gigaspora margarita]
MCTLWDINKCSFYNGRAVLLYYLQGVIILLFPFITRRDNLYTVHFNNEQ